MRVVELDLLLHHGGRDRLSYQLADFEPISTSISAQILWECSWGWKLVEAIEDTKIHRSMVAAENVKQVSTTRKLPQRAKFEACAVTSVDPDGLMASR